MVNMPIDYTQNAVHLSRDAFFEKLHSTQSAFKIEVFADVVKAYTLNPPTGNKGIATKKKMKGFSDSSRHAMIEFLAKVERTPDLFVTLTYSDDVAIHWYLNLKSDFEKFRHRLEYHYPEIQAMWRVEFVPRKSGHMKSMFIPHFHLLVWLPIGTPENRKERILEGEGQLWRNAWHEITHSTDEHHLAKFGCKVERIKSRKHAYAYCSKYLAKENEEDIEFGRRWGRIGKFEHPIELETKLTQREYIHFKRMLNAYIKAEAIKRHKNQKLNIPYPAIPLSRYLKFWRFFKRSSPKLGSTVFGLGFLSGQNINKIIRQARQQAYDERYVST